MGTLLFDVTVALVPVMLALLDDVPFAAAWPFVVGFNESPFAGIVDAFDDETDWFGTGDGVEDAADGGGVKLRAAPFEVWAALARIISRSHIIGSQLIKELLFFYYYFK